METRGARSQPARERDHEISTATQRAPCSEAALARGRGTQSEVAYASDRNTTRPQNVEDARLRMKNIWADLWDQCERMRSAYEESFNDGSSLELRELLRRAWAKATDDWADAVGGPRKAN